MKKGMFSVTAAVLFLGITQATASIYINWAASGGFYYQNGDPLIQPGSGTTVLAQLIWSSDAVANDAMESVGNFVSGNDQWLASLVLTEGANSEWGTFSSITANSGVSGGFIYARVFTTLTPSAGDWYYRGPVVAAAELDAGAEPAPSPQGYDVNRDWDPVLGDGEGVGDMVNFGPYAFQVVPVPEPGTIALFALGVATLAASRRRRKAA